MARRSSCKNAFAGVSVVRLFHFATNCYLICLHYACCEQVPITPDIKSEYLAKAHISISINTVGIGTEDTAGYLSQIFKGKLMHMRNDSATGAWKSEVSLA